MTSTATKVFIAVASLIAAAGPTSKIADAQQAGTTTPSVSHEAASRALMTVYRIAGVRDSGGPDNTGIATTFDCIHSSSRSEDYRIVIVGLGGAVVKDFRRSFASHVDNVISTRATRLSIEISLGTSYVEGYALIQSTTKDIACNAMLVDAAATVPNGIGLHMQRYNPITGTQE